MEAGVSGRRDDRPALAKVIAGVGGIDVLVVPKLDRLGRSTRHLLETVERLEAADVRLVSLKDHLDTSTPSGRLLLRVLASVAEFESDMIGERVAAVNVARMRQGKAHGRAPFGYVSQGKEGLMTCPPRQPWSGASSASTRSRAAPSARSAGASTSTGSGRSASTMEPGDPLEGAEQRHLRRGSPR